MFRLPVFSRIKDEAREELAKSRASWALARREREEAREIAQRTMDALHENHLRESVEFQLKGMGYR